MSMDTLKLTFLCLITLFLLCAGCIEGTDNRVDQPDATTLAQVTTPVSTATPATVDSDILVGTWLFTSRNGLNTVALVFYADGTLTRHDYPDGADYRGTWKQDSPNEYSIIYQDPTPTEMTDKLTYNPGMKRLYRDTLEFFVKTGDV